MAKKKDERFVKVHEEGTGFGWLRTVWVDKQTGVNYLFVNSGYAGRHDGSSRCRRQARHYPGSKRISGRLTNAPRPDGRGAFPFCQKSNRFFDSFIRRS